MGRWRGKEKRKGGSWELSALCTGKDRNACAVLTWEKETEPAVNIIITSHKTMIIEKFPAAAINKAITAAYAMIGVVALKDKQWQALECFIPENGVF